MFFSACWKNKWPLTGAKTFRQKLKLEAYSSIKYTDYKAAKAFYFISCMICRSLINLCNSRSDPTFCVRRQILITIIRCLSFLLLHKCFLDRSKSSFSLFFFQLKLLLDFFSYVLLNNFLQQMSKLTEDNDYITK